MALGTDRVGAVIGQLHSSIEDKRFGPGGSGIYIITPVVCGTVFIR